MSSLFYGLNIGKIKIDKRDVSNVTDMYCMFFMCEKFTADLSKWDVSKIIGINEMFTMAKKNDGRIKTEI